jgi:hypothetical protein
MMRKLINGLIVKRILVNIINGVHVVILNVMIGVILDILKSIGR